MAGSGSDGESSADSFNTALTSLTIAEPPPDPLFAYLPTKVKDAVTKGRVTEDTTLAHLHRPKEDDREPNDLLLQDLVLSRFAIRCQLHVENAPGDPASTQAIPSTREKGRYGYSLFLRTVDMLSAPAIRVEARFFRRSQNQKSKVFHTASLDFHFNDCDKKQLSDFTAELDDPAVITYSANGATCEGFNFEREKLTVEQQGVYDALRSLVSPGHSQRFRLSLIADSQRLQAALPALREVCSRLPGGKGHLLPTIGCQEYINFPGSAAITSPYSVMYSTPPNPMVVQSSRDTFKSMRDYVVQGRTAIAAPYFENQHSLLMFAACHGHKIALFESDDFVVIAMQFDSKMKSLGPAGKPKRTRLPKELEIEISFTLKSIGPEKTTRSFQEVVAVHEAMPLRSPHDRYDAYFVISSHDNKCFEGKLHNVTDPVPPFDTTVSTLKPHLNRTAYEHSQEALTALCNGKFDDWHPILLNQLHDDIPIVDFLADIPVDEATKGAAMATLRSCISWNEHQVRAIEEMRRAKGRLQLVDGTAGVGKTTLQIRQALLFVDLGGRALCTTTANANADHWAREADRAIRKSGKTGLRVVRLYSASKGVNIRSLTREQARLKQAGHGKGGRISTFRDLLFKKLCEKKAEAIDLSVEKLVLDEAKKRELSYTTAIEHKGRVDVWEEFRSYNEAIDKGEFDWTDGSARSGLSAIYEACKGHVVALSPIVVTTNGNARCHELVEHWGKAEELYDNTDVICKAFPPVGKITALGVLIDEAAKETEINIINTITTPGLPKKPDLVILYGDDRQLLPVNTCESKDVQINPFLGRLDISLLGRLLRQGYPHSKLLVQHRMHPEISKYPNQMFYNGELQNDACVKRDLEVVRPGLKAVLHGIIAKSFSDGKARSKYLEDTTDAQARLHWIEMPIVENIDANDRGSIRLNEHIDLFFKKIFPDLQEHFKHTMHEEVILLVGYNHALNKYEEVMQAHQERTGRPASGYPRVLTIDAAQGQEATMVLVDGSMQWADRIHFMAQPGRCNVAMTRPKHVLWVLGGPMEIKNPRVFQKYGMQLSPFAKLKRQLDKTGQVHQFR